jgi:cell division protein FtsB
MRRRRLFRAEEAAARAQTARASGFGRPGVQLATLVMVALSAWLLMSFVGQVMTGAQMDRDKATLAVTITSLEDEKARLTAQVAYVGSSAYADKVAREQLGMAHEGDVVVVPSFPEATATPVHSTPVPLPPPPSEPNWRGWARALAP